jgi:ElaB/YqjD/DUF883 family membrane-anchored ribosome-binding protein
MIRKMTRSEKEMVDNVIKDAERIEERHFNSNGGDVMEEQTNPTPMGGHGQANPSGGDMKKAQRIIDLMLELRKARETIESQLTEIKSQAKSKVSALKASENALLDALEEKDQMTLFEVDPSVSDEVQKIINDPTI